MSSYFCMSAAWSLAYLVIGYVLGLTTAHLWRISVTTPERFKRRQQIEAAILIVLGLFTIGYTVIDGRRDAAVQDEQRSCLVEQVSGITVSVTARGDLNERDSQATTKVILTIAQADNQQQVRDALNEYVAEQQEIDNARKAHPVPPFPTGSCN